MIKIQKVDGACFGRASGKTFRKIMETLKLASGGNDVMFVCISAKEVERVRNIAVNVVKAAGLKTIKSESDVIEFPFGSVRFIHFTHPEYSQMERIWENTTSSRKIVRDL